MNRASETTAHSTSPPVQNDSDDSTKAATPEETRQELKEAIKGSSEVLASATTVFPFFPDTITLDRAKFTVTKRSFIKTAEIISMRIEDVLNVSASIGPIFGSIKITSRVMSPNPPYTIGVFWRKDAIRIKRITQGYVIALQREIDCSALPVEELTKMLSQLGEDDHDTG